MDVTGLNALDVLIGLVFMYFLLSIVCSSINEMIAQAFNLRARTLEHGIRNLIGDAGKKDGAFWKDPRIRALMSERNALVRRLPKVEPRRKPSYINAKTFALVALDTIGAERAPGDKTPDRDVVAAARASAETIQNEDVRAHVLGVLGEARKDLDDLRTYLEKSFDHVMDRATGWYKRRIQIILAVIALLVTCAINADSFQVGSRLWKDDALRSAVVSQAAAAAEKDPKKAGTSIDAIADEVDDVKQLELPIGWNDANGGSFFTHLPGWLITAFALTMGAPFWFDVLGKLAQIRAVGKREGTPKDDDRHAEDRDDPSRPRPAKG
jgi:hypothetical protein